MLPKRLFGNGFVVLRHHTENDAALLQLLAPLLQFGKNASNSQAVAQLDALNSIIADDAAPQSVVQVKNQAFLESATLCSNDLHDTVGHWR